MGLFDFFGDLHINVVDDETGDPIHNALVSPHSSMGITAKLTDETGFAGFDHLLEGMSVDVVVVKSGYEPKTINNINMTDGVVSRSFGLISGAGLPIDIFGDLHVNVHDEAGLPIANALITLDCSIPITARLTDETGFAGFDNLPELLPVNVGVIKTGYVPDHKSATITDGIISVNFVLNKINLVPDDLNVLIILAVCAIIIAIIWLVK